MKELVNSNLLVCSLTENEKILYNGLCYDRPNIKCIIFIQWKKRTTGKEETKTEEG